MSLSTSAVALLVRSRWTVMSDVPDLQDTVGERINIGEHCGHIHTFVPKSIYNR